MRYPQVSYHSGPRPWDHSDTSLWASGSRYLNMALGPPGRGPGAGSARMRFCSPSIARRTKSDRMDPLVGAEGPAGVAGAVGGVPGGVQGGYHTLMVCHTISVGKWLWHLFLTLKKRNPPHRPKKRHHSSPFDRIYIKKAPVIMYGPHCGRWCHPRDPILIPNFSGAPQVG